MRISDHLPAELVFPAVEAHGPDEVMEALATGLARHYPEIDPGRLASALRERERQMGTALADGVAIPHARIAGLPRMVVAFGRSQAGIDCGSHDGKPTNFFLMIVVPAESPGAHLKLLAAASRLLHDAHCRARLMQAPDAPGLLDALRIEEDRTTGVGRAA